MADSSLCPPRGGAAPALRLAADGGFRAIVRPVIREELCPALFALGAVLAAGCGRVPVTAAEAAPRSDAPPTRAVDPCATAGGSAAAAPLAKSYTGLLRDARCREEVSSIMSGVSAALGVRCRYCHLESDYAAATQRKQIANWMARELAAGLITKHGRHPVTCAHCHRASGRGEARLLGSPRSESLAIEWMTLHMTNDFVRVDGKALRCKTCHVGNLGSSDFRQQLLLSHLAGLSLAAQPPAALEGLAPDRSGSNTGKATMPP